MSIEDNANSIELDDDSTLSLADSAIPLSKPKKTAHNKIIFTDKELAQISSMAGLGLSIDKIAIILGVGKNKLYRDKKLDPRVKQAFETGAARAELKVSKTLFDMATQEKNLTALIWWEKTRHHRTGEPKQEVRSEAETTQKVYVYLPENHRDGRPQA